MNLHSPGSEHGAHSLMKVMLNLMVRELKLHKGMKLIGA